VEQWRAWFALKGRFDFASRIPVLPRDLSNG
jgi:hypothetical protein